MGVFKVGSWFEFTCFVFLFLQPMKGSLLLQKSISTSTRHSSRFEPSPSEVSGWSLLTVPSQESSGFLDKSVESIKESTAVRIHFFCFFLFPHLYHSHIGFAFPFKLKPLVTFHHSPQKDLCDEICREMFIFYSLDPSNYVIPLLFCSFYFTYL